MSATLVIDVHVEPEWSLPLLPSRVEEALAHVLRAEGVEEATVSVAFVGDEQISALNRDYLEHDGPTDVISFPLHGAGEPVLGDVYVGVPQAERQAADLDVPIDVELLRLAIHGTLHVLGYDHPEDEGREASPMYRRQEELLAEVLQ